MPGRVWRVPCTKTADVNDKPFEVPLCDYLVALLTRLQAQRLHERFVFPMGENAMRNCLRKIVPGALTVHGFRAWVDEKTHVHPDVAETCLSHRIVGDDVEIAYRRSTMLDKRRQLLTAWADYALDGDPAAKVIPLRA